ncbi:O-antigen/teichoic acid export membrane protein [Arthrobacter sp. UYEF6]
MKAIVAALMRLATFALTVGAGTVVGLLAIPVITGIVGADAWAIQALVQSLATLFGVLVAFGWGTVGPGMVASTKPALRPQLFLDSFVTRGYLFLVAAPLMVAFMIILQPKDAVFVAIASVAYLLPYLGASWYFVGEARPMRLFLVDALPQLAGTIVGLVVLVATRDFTMLVITQLLFNLGAVVLSIAVVLSGNSCVKADFSLRTSLSQMASQRHGVVTAATGSLYVNLPILVVKVLIPDQLDAYALADRLFRFAVTAFSPVLQFIQGWIPEGGLQSMAHRIHRATQLTPALGLIGGTGLAALGPLAADVLVRGTTDFGLGLSIPIGFSFAAVAVSQVLGLACLVSLGRSRELAKSTVIGAIVGAPLILLGAFTNGVVGVAWAVAVSEIAVTAFQFLVLRRYFASLK